MWNVKRKGLWSVLAIGLCLGGLFYLTIKINYEVIQENRVNDHLPNTFRVITKRTNLQATTMAPLAQALKETFPSYVKAATTLRKGEKSLVNVGDERFFTGNYFFVDPDFIDVFELQVLAGDGRQPLNEPGSVVLTQQFANRYFGNVDPIGMSMALDDEMLTVRSVVDNVTNSHLSIDFLLPMKSFVPPSYGSLDNWGWLTFYTYLKLDPDQKENIEGQLEELLATRGSRRIADAIDIQLQHAADIYNEGLYFEDGNVIAHTLVSEKKHQVIAYVMLILLAGLSLIKWRNQYMVMALLIIIFGLGIKSVLGYWKAKTSYHNYRESLGFETENYILEFDHPILQSNYLRFRSELLAHPSIDVVGGGNHIMEGMYGSYSIYPLEDGKRAEQGKRVNFYPVHYQFFQSMDIPFFHGSEFTERSNGIDTLRGLILNESAAKLLCKDGDFVGQQFFIAGQGGINGIVKGVVKDFMFSNEKAGPLVSFFRDDAFDFVVIKPSEPIIDVEGVIGEVWNKYYEGLTPDIQRHSDRKDFMGFSEKQAVAAHLETMWVTLMVAFILLLSNISKINLKRS